MTLKSFLTVITLFLYFENSNAQQDYSCNLLSKVIDDEIVIVTPASDKIVFSKIIKNEKQVFNVQLYAFGSSLDAGKGIHIILANGKEIKNPDVPVEVGIPDSYKVAFKYSGTLMLDDHTILYFKNFPVKECRVGNFHFVLSKKEQSMFLDYFNCLLKVTDPEELVVGQAQSW